MATLYQSMVRPHLEYGNVIWGPFYAGDKKMVESVQRRATKLIPELREMPYEQRLRALDLPSLEYRRSRGDMIQCYKIFNKIVRMNVEELFTPVPPSTTQAFTSGHPHRVLRQRATHRTRANCFSQRVIEKWNALPVEVVGAETVDQFKSKLDEYWIHKRYETSAV